MREKLCQIVKEAGALLLSARHPELSVHEKTNHWDLVTKYDTMVQAFLRQRLLELLPGAGFLGEEEYRAEDWSRYEWLFIVDPIDGTSNFIRGVRCSCVSVGLLHKGVPALGAVYDPYSDELYSAEAGCGAALNGRPIRVSDRDLAHGFLLFGSGLYYRELVDRTLAVFNRAFPLVQDIRRFGSAALDLCYVAVGRAECFYELRLCPWDYAAGALILQEAGGFVSQPDGSPLDLYEKCPVVAGNPKCYGPLLALVAETGKGGPQ